jgi:hypothetical protein
LGGYRGEKINDIVVTVETVLKRGAKIVTGGAQGVSLEVGSPSLVYDRWLTLDLVSLVFVSDSENYDQRGTVATNTIRVENQKFLQY